MRGLDFSGVDLTGDSSQLGRGTMQSLKRSEKKQKGLFAAMKLHDLVLPQTRKSGAGSETTNQNVATEIGSSRTSLSTRMMDPLNRNTDLVATLLHQVKMCFKFLKCFINASRLQQQYMCSSLVIISLLLISLYISRYR